MKGRREGQVRRERDKEKERGREISEHVRKFKKKEKIAIKKIKNARGIR